jgi:Mrp family chromosome partitioning ATPase
VDGYAQELAGTLRGRLEALPGVRKADVQVKTRILSHAVQHNLKPLAGAKNIIAVASGKGGVGKSTLAVNLALALAADGARVGILDADIYGPSQPRMLGTGDIQLTLAQRVPVSGAVIVTTPQEIALLDARKGLKMFQKVEVGILGIVENMSTHVCSQCGHEEHIFGAGGGERMAKQYGVPFLGSLPLDVSIREQTDGGKPSVVSDPKGPVAQRYRDIARRATAQLALAGKDYAGAFPKIVIEE